MTRVLNWISETDNTHIVSFEEGPEAWTMVGKDIPGSMTFLKSKDPQFWTSSGTETIPFTEKIPSGVTHLKCDACHRMIPRYYSKMRDVGHTGKLMCYQCFSVAQLQCQDCHGIFERDQVTAINWFTMIFCKTCESKAQLVCRDCHNTFPRAEIEIVGDYNEMVCKPCWAQAKSEWCGCDWFLNSSVNFMIVQWYVSTHITQGRSRVGAVALTFKKLEWINTLK